MKNKNDKKGFPLAAVLGTAAVTGILVYVFATRKRHDEEPATEIDEGGNEVYPDDPEDYAEAAAAVAQDAEEATVEPEDTIEDPESVPEEFFEDEEDKPAEVLEASEPPAEKEEAPEEEETVSNNTEEVPEENEDASADVEGPECPEPAEETEPAESVESVEEAEEAEDAEWAETVYYAADTTANPDVVAEEAEKMISTVELEPGDPEEMDKVLQGELTKMYEEDGE